LERQGKPERLGKEGRSVIPVQVRAPMQVKAGQGT
jgi:hypothetical protein